MTNFLKILIGCITGLIYGANVYSMPLTLVYSGNLDGELEPCGCSEEGNLGGIKRRVTTIDSLREQYPQLLLLSSGGLLAAEGVTDQIKSAYIIKGFRVMNYDAIGMQWRDLAYGPEFIADDPLPWVVSNWSSAGVSAEKTIRRSVDENNIEIKIFGWLDPSESPMRQMHGDHTVVGNDAVAINKKIQAADRQGALTVVSTSMPLESAKEIFNLDVVDVLFIRSSYEVFGEPQKVGKTLVLQPGSRGMRLAQVDMQLSPSGDIQTFSHKIISMPNSVPDAERMSAWYDEYNEKVKQDYLKRVEIRKQRESGVSDYVGEEQCKSCHAAQYKIWFDSQHAIAFDDLEAVNKSFDPVCIQCHTVGFNQPGGFVDMSITSHLLGVQCESCHGAARQHVQSGGQKPPANHQWPKEKVCGQCHVQKHSPSFNLENYWQKIAH